MFLSAVGASGFAIGILTHVFHMKKFYPIAKRALLLSLVNYLTIFLILFIEIGRWDNFYWIFVSFAGWSPLYEVFVCLTLYFILQLIEVFEIWCAHHGFGGKIAEVFISIVSLIACVVPFGQEAALGAIYMSIPGKLDVLWDSQFMPWGCMISAFFGGTALMAVEYNTVSKMYSLEKDSKMIYDLIKIGAVVLWIYFVLKVIDLGVRGCFAEAFAGDKCGNMFLVEMLIGVALPGILAFTPMVKRPDGQVFYGFLVIFGIMINRFNFMFVGLTEYRGVSYFPSFCETLIIAGLLCLAALLYVWLIENLPILQGKNDKTYKVVTLPPDKI
jgi:Ni/Fe-hydrogenase subunit HybB-like protein